MGIEKGRDTWSIKNENKKYSISHILNKRQHPNATKHRNESVFHVVPLVFEHSTKSHSLHIDLSPGSNTSECDTAVRGGVSQ